jgi:hypothetical protein
MRYRMRYMRYRTNATNPILTYQRPISLPPILCQQTLPTQLAHDQLEQQSHPLPTTQTNDDGNKATFLCRCLSPKPKPPVPLPFTKDEADDTDDTDDIDCTDDADKEAVLRRGPPCRRPPLPPQS